MKRLVPEVIAELAAHGTADAIIHLITDLCACETAAAMTAVLGVGTATGLIVPAVLLVGAKLLVGRQDRKEAAEFDRHCDKVISLLQEIRGGVEGSSDKLSKLVEHETWVWARISGVDQAAFARRVSKEVYKALKDLNIDTFDHVQGLVIYSETILHNLDEVKEGVDEVVRILRTDLRDSSERERKLRDALADSAQQIEVLKASVTAVHLAAAGGDSEAQYAIRVIRATGDAKMLQHALERLADKDEKALVKRCREIVALAYVRGDIDTATQRLEKINAIIPNDPEVISWRGRIHSLRGDFDDAIEQFKRLLDLDDAWKAVAFASLGAIARTRGKLDDAEKNHGQALAIDERLGRKERAAIDLSQLGLVARKRGNLELAEECHRKAVDAIRNLNWPEGLAICLGSLGITLRERGERGEQGKLDEAENTLRETLKLNENIGRMEGIAFDLGNLAMIELFRHNFVDAEKLAKDALEIDRALGDKRGQGILLHVLSDIAKGMNRQSDSEEYSRQAEEIEAPLGLAPRTDHP